MALVVFLRGVNVGGHRTFRPSALVKHLSQLDIVNIGAAGTFVVRSRISQAALRKEFQRCLPFDTLAMICGGADLLRLVSQDPFASHVARKDIVPFVSVLAAGTNTMISTPFCLPENGPWSLKVLGKRGCFVVGMYRREMRAIRYLGELDKLLGVPVTTRNWNTIMAIAKVLQNQ